MHPGKDSVMKIEIIVPEASIGDTDSMYNSLGVNKQHLKKKT